MHPRLHILYYFEAISSWCHWAEPAWTELRARFAGRADFEWRVALMDSSGMPVSRAQCDWFYRRSGIIVRSHYMLNSGWFEQGLSEYLAPNLVPEAAKDFGVTDDRVRLAIAHAALREGQRVADWQISTTVAVAAAPDALDHARLLAHARSPEVEARARASTAEFHALRLGMRPAFVLTNTTGDTAVFSGLAKAAPLIAAAEALWEDQASLMAYTAHHGDPPAA